MQTGQQPNAAHTIWTSPWVMTGMLLLLASLTRFIGIGDHGARTDELFHIIAGRSWAENGSFAIMDGNYERSWLYTVATGIIGGRCSACRIWPKRYTG